MILFTTKPEDPNANVWRWELRWHWRLRPFFERDSFMDGGSRFWSVGPVSLYRWIVHPGEETK